MMQINKHSDIIFKTMITSLSWHTKYDGYDERPSFATKIKLLDQTQ